MSQVSAGRVGRTHGRNGSFYVDGPAHPLDEGTEITVRGRTGRIERRGGTADRPLVRVSGVDARDAAAALRGEPLVVEDELAADEFLAADLEGCAVEGLGTVRRVLDGPSCALLELEDGTLLPFVSDAIRHVDQEARVIRVDGRFIGVER